MAGMKKCASMPGLLHPPWVVVGLYRCTNPKCRAWQARTFEGDYAGITCPDCRRTFVLQFQEKVIYKFVRCEPARPKPRR